MKNKGVAYGGISAGTLLASPNIESAGWEPYGDPNDVNITDLSALNFVNFTSMVHYSDQHKSTIEKYKSSDEIVYTIPDGGMIVVGDEKITLLGDAKKY